MTNSPTAVLPQQDAFTITDGAPPVKRSWTRSRLRDRLLPDYVDSAILTLIRRGVPLPRSLRRLEQVVVAAWESAWLLEQARPDILYADVFQHVEAFLVAAFQPRR